MKNEGQPFWRGTLKGIGWLAAALLAYTNFRSVLSGLANPAHKDLRATYLLAQALAHGVNPYQSLVALGQRWLPGVVLTDFSHPTPHTFAHGWLALPLAAFSYPNAAKFWFGLQCGCLFAALILWLRLQDTPLSVGRVCSLLVLAWAWPPLMVEFWHGQISLCLLVLFLGAWLALRQGHALLAGGLLGSLVVLKLMGVPILLWLLIHRRWRAIGAAAAVWLGAHGVAVGLHGWDVVWDYYTKVGPLVGAIYRTQEFNLSWWTLGQRLFGGMHWFIAVAPLWEAPLLAKLVGVLAPLCWLYWLLYAANKARHLDTSFALLMSGGFLLSPVAWVHYLVLALPAVYLVLKRLAERQWPWRWTLGVGLTLTLVSLPHGVYATWTTAFAQGVNATGQPLVSALPGLLLLLPLVGLWLLLWELTALEAPSPQPVPQAVLTWTLEVSAQ